MAKKKSSRADTAKTAFVRGFIATGMLAAIDRGSGPAAASRALKAGIAVATGTLTADLIREKAPVQAAVALAGGALCLMAVERGAAQKSNKESEVHG